MIKKIISLFLVLTLCVSLAACGEKSDNSNQGDSTTILNPKDEGNNSVSNKDNEDNAPKWYVIDEVIHDYYTGFQSGRVLTTGKYDVYSVTNDELKDINGDWDCYIMLKNRATDELITLDAHKMMQKIPIHAFYTYVYLDITVDDSGKKFTYKMLRKNDDENVDVTNISYEEAQKVFFPELSAEQVDCGVYDEDKYETILASEFKPGYVYTFKVSPNDYPAVDLPRLINDIDSKLIGTTIYLEDGTFYGRSFSASKSIGENAVYWGLYSAFFDVEYYKNNKETTMYVAVFDASFEDALYSENVTLISEKEIGNIVTSAMNHLVCNDTPNVVYIGKRGAEKEDCIVLNPGDIACTGDENYDFLYID